MTNVTGALLLIALYTMLCGFCYWRYARRERPSASLGARVIAYGSQSGRAQALAQALAARASKADVGAAISLNQLARADLSGVRQLVVITSTYGEGDAPDNAALLLPVLEKLSPTALGELKIAVLGLGDRSYQRFCGYAADVERALLARAATRALPLETMNAFDERQWHAWQQTLAEHLHWPLGAAQEVQAFATWTLHQREQSNPKSVGAPAYTLALVPDGAIARDQWQAGDIAEIQPENTAAAIAWVLGARSFKREDMSEALRCVNLRELDSAQAAALNSDAPLTADWLSDLPRLPTRYYSIASVPREQKILLLVRQKRLDDGSLGLGSGYLTQQLQVAEPLRLQVRSNPNFHAAPDTAPIILIGNGTGIAGLRAHLAARAHAQLLAATQAPAQAPATAPAWLMFGERTADADQHFAADLHKWQARGVLAHWQTAFSRDPGGARYVQDLIAPNHKLLCQWVDDGAYIFVCGSQRGMAAGVNAALTTALGESRLQMLRDTGRYRRDVY